MIKSTSKILLIINLFVVGSVNASLTDIEDLRTTFTEIHNGCWRNTSVPDSKQSISKILIQSFENKHQDKQKLKDIIKLLPLELSTVGKNISFWEEEYREDRNMEDVFLGLCNAFDDPWFHNNPRVQQLILNCRELFRFEAKFQSVSLEIFHSKFENDDVVRALSLSGTFCKRSKTKDDENKPILDDDGKIVYEFDPLFSGMLIPGQPHNDKHYYVHSCRHGFIGERLYKLYFIPYGMRINKGFTPNYEDAFQVIDLRKNVNTKACFSEYELLSVEKQKSGYLQEDYAMVRIKSNSEYEVDNVSYQKNLVTVLKERNKRTNNLFNRENLFPGIDDGNMKIPDFIGNNSDYDQQFKDFKLDRNLLQQYFTIGRPGDPNYQFNDGAFAITTNLTDDIIVNPKRSLSDDCDKLNPQVISNTKQIASDFPSYPGMSGGIVLSTITLIKNGRIERIARPIGTIWGSERRFDDAKNCISLNSFINLINNN